MGGGSPSVTGRRFAVHPTVQSAPSYAGECEIVRNVLAVATIPVGLIASTAWVAFIAFEFFKLVQSLF